ncbi:MAG: hypothetical protein ABIW79_01540, partial [Gemmatimonas sp.]
VELDKPVWATDAFGVEITLGVLSSADVSSPGSRASDTVPLSGAIRVGTSGTANLSTSPGLAAAIGVNVNLMGTLSEPQRRYTPLPTTPAAEFDLALLVPEATSAGEVESALKQAGGDLLERTMLFDEFRGAGIPDGFRSLAWRLTFRHPERTLRDKEIEGRRNQLLKILADELGIRPRAS